MYIANKLCRFEGHNFLKGEVIPENYVLKSKVAQLVKTKVIRVVDDAEVETAETVEETVETAETAETVEKTVETAETVEDVSIMEQSNEPEPVKRGRKKSSN